MKALLPQNYSIFLADDDADDRLLFEEALHELNTDVNIKTANNGEQLMQILDKEVPPTPNIIFLDLNMPLKNGFECLTEIKKDKKFKNIPVVIFSTSCQKEAMDKVYQNGADYYICKPDSFQKLKQLIKNVFEASLNALNTRPNRDNFNIVA